MGFIDERAMEEFLLTNPALVQGGYAFDASAPDSMDFMVLQNSTTARMAYGSFTRPFLSVSIPMHVQALTAIAQLRGRGQESFQIGMREFAHPPLGVSNFEDQVAPLFLLGIYSFQIVMQLSEVLSERDQQLRLMLAAMGVLDVAYWLSWHLFQLCVNCASALSTVVFGLLFDLKVFRNNDSATLFFLFLLFGQSLSGFSFMLGSVLRRPGPAVAAATATFVTSVCLFFLIVMMGVPYGRWRDVLPMGYKRDEASGAVVEERGAGATLGYLLAAFPPTLFIHSISALSVIGVQERGVALGEVFAYCNPAAACDPRFSVGNTYVALLLLYLLYSLAAVYLENVLPDTMGVRRGPLYFLARSYWKPAADEAEDDAEAEAEAEAEEELDDPEAAAEEAAGRARSNLPMEEEHAVEVRGLRVTRGAGASAVIALRAPWLALRRHQIFVLLGPNGSGKTSLANALAGFIPCAGGNALVYGHSVKRPAGIAAVRRLLGVCPQFDVLWAELTAREHLSLFGALKGVAAGALAAEVQRRLECVGLEGAADQCAGAYSGGMRRRLTVAASLIGDPKLVIMDEPTTGIDPINRRKVWEGIAQEGRARCVLLTTHSMEEAEYLGDRLGLLVKGRVVALGSSSALKQRYGSDYRVSFRSAAAPSASTQREWEQKLQSPLTERNGRFLCQVAASDTGRLIALLETLEGREEDAGGGGMQIEVEMPSLDSVFHAVVHRLQAAEASQIASQSWGDALSFRFKSFASFSSFRNWRSFSDRQARSATLSPLSVPSWRSFSDRQPRSAAVSPLSHRNPIFNRSPAKRSSPEPQPRAEMVFAAHWPSTEHAVASEDTERHICATSSDAASMPAAGGGDACQPAPSPFFLNPPPDPLPPRLEPRPAEEELEVDSTPMLTAADPSGGALDQFVAIVLKNATLLLRNPRRALAVLLAPLFFIFVALVQQLAKELVLLNQPDARCPYCGPDDACGRDYCGGAKSCPDYFFGGALGDAASARMGIDVLAACKETALRCGGGGNLSCFQPQWATHEQIAFCPFPSGKGQPVFLASPPNATLSASPVLISGSARAARALAEAMEADARQGEVALRAAMQDTTHAWYTLLTALPLVGCLGANANASLQNQVFRAACQLVQHGHASPEACCADLSGGADVEDGYSLRALAAGEFAGSLRFGVHYWSDALELRSDAGYAARMRDCDAPTRGLCNQQIYRRFSNASAEGGGAVFASGAGKEAAARMIEGLGLAPNATLHLQAAVAGLPPSMQCSRPQYPEGVAAELGGHGKCVNLQEGLAVVAGTLGLPTALHPDPEPSRGVPGCALRGDCKFAGANGFRAPSGGRWAQVCDYHSRGLRAAGSATSVEELQAVVSEVPCVCRALFFLQSLLRNRLFRAPAADGGSGDNAAAGAAGELRRVWDLPGVRWVTEAWGAETAFREAALEVDAAHWWSQQAIPAETRRADPAPTEEAAVEPRGCGGGCGGAGGAETPARGQFKVVAVDCEGGGRGVACFLQSAGNLSGWKVGCLEQSSRVVEGEEARAAEYQAFWLPGREQRGGREQLISGFDVRALDERRVEATVVFNETTVLWTTPDQPLAMLRLNAQLNMLSAAILGEGATAQMRGIKEMPKPATRRRTDHGAVLTPFFFMMACMSVFPGLASWLVREKELRFRLYVRLMGLRTATYWAATSLCFCFIQMLFMAVLVLCSVHFALPSGHQIDIFVRHDTALVVVVVLVFTAYQLTFTMLFSTALRSARVAEILAPVWACFVVFVGEPLLDPAAGNFLYEDSVSSHTKLLLTVVPGFTVFRALVELQEAASEATALQNPGLRLSSLQPGDGLGLCLVVMAVSSLLFLCLAMALDRFYETGQGADELPSWLRALKTQPDGAAARPASELGRRRGSDVEREANATRENLAGAPEGRHPVLVHGLRSVYRQWLRPDKVAVDGITLHVAAGECLGLLGPNGAGKTTTIHTLVGLTRPSAGEAEVCGLSLRSSLAAIRRRIGVCLQHDVLWEGLTVREHLMMNGRLRYLRGANLRARVEEAAAALRIDDVLDRKVAALSGGMKRRLSVAITLLGTSPVCYLDEPSTGLDPVSRRVLWESIKAAKRERAVLLTTHYMHEAQALCDRVGFFVAGGLRAIDSPASIVARFAGVWLLSVTCDAERVTCDAERVPAFQRSLLHVCPDAERTYSVKGRLLFQLPRRSTRLSLLFRTVIEQGPELGVRDWAIVPCSLDQAFQAICS